MVGGETRVCIGDVAAQNFYRESKENQSKHTVQLHNIQHSVVTSTEIVNGVVQ